MHKTVFTKNEDARQIVVERKFNAPKEKVWAAWTTAELLEKWWAPAPWTAVTKTFDFSEGGHWHYYMSGPEGEKVWCWVGYLTIDPQNEFTADDGFCDEAGVRSADMPSMHWHTEFKLEDGATLTRTTITFPTIIDLEKVVAMGFESGFGLGLDQLSVLLGDE